MLTPLTILRDAMIKNPPKTEDALRYMESVLAAIDMLLPDEVETCVIINKNLYDTTGNQRCDFHDINLN